MVDPVYIARLCQGLSLTNPKTKPKMNQSGRMVVSMISEENLREHQYVNPLWWYMVSFSGEDRKPPPCLCLDQSQSPKAKYIGMDLQAHTRKVKWGTRPKLYHIVCCCFTRQRVTSLRSWRHWHFHSNMRMIPIWTIIIYDIVFLQAYHHKKNHMNNLVELYQGIQLVFNHPQNGILHLHHRSFLQARHHSLWPFYEALSPLKCGAWHP